MNINIYNNSIKLDCLGGNIGIYFNWTVVIKNIVLIKDNHHQ